jgi:guanidinopropionase
MTDAADLASAREAMQRWYWWGIPTFFRAPWNEDPAGSDIAVIGVPHSSGNGSTERDQHLGPRAVRNVSALYRRGHGRFGIVPWDLCRIADAGDVPLPEAMVNDVSVGHIEAYARRFDAAGTRLVAIGGDHSITGPLLKAVGGPGGRLSGGRPVALVHFDAHTDSYHHLPHWLGSRRSAAHWASYTVREGHVDAARSTQVGIRPNVGTPGSTSTSEALGYRVVGMDEVEEIGWRGVVDILRARIGDAPVYITFDMDSLDPCDAPGVSNLEPGYPGLRVGEAVRILQGLRGLDVIGGDVVCLMPTKDAPNQITAMNAAVVAFEMIALMADRLAAARRVGLPGAHSSNVAIR